MITESEMELLASLRKVGLPGTLFDATEEDWDIARINDPMMDPDSVAILFLAKHHNSRDRERLVRRLVKLIEGKGWNNETVICNFQELLPLTFPLAITDERGWSIFAPLYQCAFAGIRPRYNPNRYYVSSVFNALVGCIRSSGRPVKSAVDNVMNWMKQSPAFYWMSDEFHGWIDDVLAEIMKCGVYDDSFKSLIGLIGKMGRRAANVGDVRLLDRLDACLSHMRSVFDSSGYDNVSSFECRVAMRYEFETHVSPINIAINTLREITVKVGGKLASLSQGLIQWIPGQEDFVGMKIFSACSDTGDGHFKLFNIEVAIWPRSTADTAPEWEHFEKTARLLSVQISHRYGDYSKTFNFKLVDGRYVARARLVLPSFRNSISIIVNKKEGGGNLSALEIPIVLIHGDEKPTVLTEACGMKFDNNSRWETLG